MKKLFLLLVSSLMLVQLPSAAQNMHTYKTDLNIPYRAQPNSDDYINKQCRLDVYAPVNAQDAPVVVWFHGGGLTEGTRYLPDQLKNQGFIVVPVSYRLSPHVKVKDCVDDAAAAVAWVYNNIAKYGGSTKKLYIAGHSAGGYLTLMIGLDKKYLAKYGIDADRMAALLPYSAQVITHQTARRENGIENTQPVIDEMAPLFHVRKDAPAIVLTTGDREMEMLGRYEEVAYLWRMFKIVGHKNVILYEFDGFDHGGMPLPAHDVTVRYIKGKEVAGK